MIGIRYENYKGRKNDLPLVLNVGLERSALNSSKEKNWHENVELQLCTDGAGTVLLNGEHYDFNKGDIIVVNSNVIHYTQANERLIYTCLIIDTDFCKQYGFDYDALCFEDRIRDGRLEQMIHGLTEAYLQKNDPLRKARVTEILLRLLIELRQNYSSPKERGVMDNRTFEAVKTAIVFIRRNYSRRITLDELSREILLDKYTLCREFKRLTGQTVVENINRYRCERAIEHIAGGYSVAEAARACGFENLSFFTKTFKKIYGRLPSEFKKLR